MSDQTTSMHAIPYATPGQRPASIGAAAVLAMTGLGLIVLGGCFLIGVLACHEPQFFTPSAVKSAMTPGEILFVTILYLLATACFVSAVWILSRTVTQLLRLTRGIIPSFEVPRTISYLRGETIKSSTFLDYPPEKEAEAQRKILRYFRDRGIDVTSEMSTQYRIDPFIGLQPWAMHFKPVGKDVPPSLYCGGTVVLSPIVRKDRETLPGLVEAFCTQTVPWCYYNRYWSVAGTKPADMESWIDNPKSTAVSGVPMPTGDDLCMPATWREKTMIAWSKNGYEKHTWPLPAEWKGVQKAKVSEITLEGPKLLEEIEVRDGITLGLKAGQGVIVEAEK